MSSNVKRPVDFNVYEKKSDKKLLEIMELHRRANMVNSRIRDVNRDMIYSALNQDVTAS